MDLTGTLGSSGAVTRGLPSESTEGDTLPVIACYISETGTTWLAVAQSPSDPNFTFCGLTGVGTGNPSVTLVNGPTGWLYYIIAVW